MLDAAMLTLVVVCFVLAQSYAKLCDRLLALSADNDVAA
jgi:hypothetical protein